MLENVIGGLTCKQTATIINVGVYTAVGTGIGAISCTVASAIYNSKAAKATQKGDVSNSIKYNNTAKYLSIVGASLGGIAITAAAVNFGVSVNHGKNCTKCGIGKPPNSLQ